MRLQYNLGDPKREGHSFWANCPICGERLLALWRGKQDGELKVKCYYCNDWAAPRAAMVDMGLIAPNQMVIGPSGPSDEQKTMRALARLWARGDRIAGTPAEAYLARRAIPDPNSTVLAYLPHAPYGFWRDAPEYPAMVALIQHAEQNAVAVQVTYLTLDGDRIDAEPFRKNYGPVGGAGVWFGWGWGPPGPDDELIIAEGVESTLSAMIILGSRYGCAALSEGGMRHLIVPPWFKRVHIAADSDANGAGQKAAATTERRLLDDGLGRTVRISSPKRPADKDNWDFNDLLMKRRHIRE